MNKKTPNTIYSYNSLTENPLYELLTRDLMKEVEKAGKIAKLYYWIVNNPALITAIFVFIILLIILLIKLL